jgi:hypothetical protein
MHADSLAGGSLAEGSLARKTEKGTKRPLRPPLGAQNPAGIPEFPRDRPTAWDSASGQLFPPFGSPQARDAATLAPRFPRADPSRAPDW